MFRESENENNAQIEMKLSPARYTIVTIAGLGEEYVIPENPRLDDVIVMRAGNRSARAMMMGTVLSNLFQSSNACMTEEKLTQLHTPW